MPIDNKAVSETLRGRMETIADQYNNFTDEVASILGNGVKAEDLELRTDGNGNLIDNLHHQRAINLLLEKRESLLQDPIGGMGPTQEPTNHGIISSALSVYSNLVSADSELDAVEPLIENGTYTPNYSLDDPLTAAQRDVNESEIALSSSGDGTGPNNAPNFTDYRPTNFVGRVRQALQ